MAPKTPNWRELPNKTSTGVCSANTSKLFRLSFSYLTYRLSMDMIVACIIRTVSRCKIRYLTLEFNSKQHTAPSSIPSPTIPSYRLQKKFSAPQHHFHTGNSLTIVHIVITRSTSTLSSCNGQLSASTRGPASF